MTATTLSLLMSFLTAEEGWPGLDWSSSTMSLTLCPSRPPALLISSAASCTPLSELMPNVASLPVSDAYSPTGMSCARPGAVDASSANERASEDRSGLGFGMGVF